MLVRAQARVNVAAIERNVATLAAAANGTPVCAVVKADGYGHGAAAAGRAALAGGASWLAVAAAKEAVELREAGITEAPLLVLGALTPGDLDAALAARADVTVWTDEMLDAVAARGGRVHIKLDTGMGRLGTRDVSHATILAQRAAQTPGVELVGAMTHFATADERGDAFFGEQLTRFTAWVEALRAAGLDVIAHAANSAALLRDPACHFDLVRPGVGIYGLDPFGEDPAAYGLEPALELSSWVAAVKAIEPGQSAGYGRRFVAEHVTWLATVPIGYGDGWRRALTNNAEVLVAGARAPLVGTVSMDNITVELAAADAAKPGDEVVLIGARGGERILSEDVAERLGTINYEVTCGLLPRVPRMVHRDGDPL
ncbi:MAG: alanine racemase [Solirubrobacteraceae bacterium]|nr:alanine racemase [Solirubrobacteraceae bacterium]